MNAHFEVVELLKLQLQCEGKDKTFLLDLLRESCNPGQDVEQMTSDSENSFENSKKQIKYRPQIIQNRVFDGNTN